MNEIGNYKTLIRHRRGLLLPVVAPLGDLAEAETQKLEQQVAVVADQMREAADLAFAVYGHGYARIIAHELAAYEQELEVLRRELGRRGERWHSSQLAKQSR